VSLADSSNTTSVWRQQDLFSLASEDVDEVLGVKSSLETLAGHVANGIAEFLLSFDDDLN